MLKEQNKWPCFFFNSDTTGEKDFEEFFTENETIDFNKFINLGVIKNKPDFDSEKLDYFLKSIDFLDPISHQFGQTFLPNDLFCHHIIVVLFHFGK